MEEKKRKVSTIDIWDIDLESLTTDELIDIVINDIGLSLPVYDYDYRMYQSSCPSNVLIGDTMKGIERCDLHKTFREGCIRIINCDIARDKILVQNIIETGHNPLNLRITPKNKK